MQTGTLSLITAEPKPVFLVKLLSGVSQHKPDLDWFSLLKGAATLSPDRLTFRDIVGCAARGVSIDRLPVVLASGIDVEPSTAPIFVDDFDKAVEYGGWPKLVLALSPSHLDRTYREIPATASADDVDSLRQMFPTMLASKDGTHIWLSRFPEDSTYLASPYEWGYARWIPGDPRDALIAAFIFVHADVGGFDGLRTLAADRPKASQ